MKKAIFIVITLVLCTVCIAGATRWNIRARATSDWFGGDNLRNIPLQWMRAVDPLIAMGSNPGTGHIFYVDSGVTNAGDGSDWENAKATLDEAVGLCAHNRGDIILIAQGHTEALGAAADEVDIDVNGVTVEGLGSGTLRPLFDYTDYETGAFAIGAENVTIYNLVFKANTPDVNDAIDIESAGDYARVIKCDFIVESAGTDEFQDCISLGDAADFVTIEHCMMDMQGGAAEAGIHMDYDTEGMIIRHNFIRGDYSAACIQGDTTLSTNLLIEYNTLWNGDTAALNTVECIELLTGTVGIIQENKLVTNVATVNVAMVGDAVFLFNNWYNEDAGIDKTGVAWHVYDANDTIVNSVAVSGDD